MRTAHIEAMDYAFTDTAPFAVVAVKRMDNEPVMIMHPGGEAPHTFTSWRDANMHASTVNEYFSESIANAHVIDLRHYV